MDSEAEARNFGDAKAAKAEVSEQTAGQPDGVEAGGGVIENTNEDIDH